MPSQLAVSAAGAHDLGFFVSAGGFTNRFVPVCHVAAAHPLASLPGFSHRARVIVLYNPASLPPGCTTLSKASILAKPRESETETEAKPREKKGKRKGDGFLSLFAAGCSGAPLALTGPSAAVSGAAAAEAGAEAAPASPEAGSTAAAVVRHTRGSRLHAGSELLGINPRQVIAWAFNLALLLVCMSAEPA